jgi:hypothetical protein
MVLSTFPAKERGQAEAACGKPTHHRNRSPAGVSAPSNTASKAAPTRETPYDWVGIFSPEGVTTVALLNSFIQQHLSGQPFGWEEVDAAKVKPPPTHVHQVLLCGTDFQAADESSSTKNVTKGRGRPLRLQDGVGEIDFEWTQEDRCKIEVQGDTAAPGTRRARTGPLRYKVLVSAVDPRLLRLSWLTVDPAPKSEGPAPPAYTFTIGQDGQPHPGIRPFPYMTSGWDVIPWSLSFLYRSPTMIFTFLAALLALVGCANWRGYCWGLDIESKTLPTFTSVSDYVGHSLEVLVSPGALLFIAGGGILYATDVRLFPWLLSSWWYSPALICAMLVMMAVVCFFSREERAKKTFMLTTAAALTAFFIPLFMLILAAVTYGVLR